MFGSKPDSSMNVETQDIHFMDNIINSNFNNAVKNILFPYQQDAVKRIYYFLLKNKSNAAYNACDTGTGKTIIAITTALSLRNRHFNQQQSISESISKSISTFQTIVLCPAVMRLTWEREIKNWCGRLADYTPSISIVVGTSENELKTALTSDWVVLTYDTAAKHKALLAQHKIELLIADEAHAIKAHGKSKRARAFRKEIFPAAHFKILQSATPFTRNIVDCYNPFSLIYPEDPTLRDFFNFANTYAHTQITPWGIKYTGLKNAEKLSKLIRENFYVRYRKEEVLKQLPPVTYSIVELSESLAVKVEGGEDFIEQIKQALLNKKTLTKDVTAAFASLRRKQGEAKIKDAAEYCEELLEQDIPLVIFAHHVSVVEGLAKELAEYKPERITGATSPAKRQEYIDNFQNGKIQCLILNIVAGGVGVTLTRANNVVMVEQSFLPSENYQAISRCHRIGTSGAVTVHWLSVRNSIDDKIMNVVMKRTQEFNAVCN